MRGNGGSDTDELDRQIVEDHNQMEEVRQRRDFESAQRRGAEHNRVELLEEQEVRNAKNYLHTENLKKSQDEIGELKNAAKIEKVRMEAVTKSLEKVEEEASSQLSQYLGLVMSFRDDQTVPFVVPPTLSLMLI